ncbi:uncharacterized protein FFMR_08880 [Fusarium fujikuroi]|nr:uncharacterized protein FFMR_08880 [Fusarium fujikuroi]
MARNDSIATGSPTAARSIDSRLKPRGRIDHASHKRSILNNIARDTRASSSPTEFSPTKQHSTTSIRHPYSCNPSHLAPTPRVLLFHMVRQRPFSPKSSDQIPDLKNRQ